MLLPKCICGSERFSSSIGYNHIPLMECDHCGIARQEVDMTEKEYADYYRNDYHATEYKHDYNHDCEVAAKRIDKYGSRLGGSVLDVGAGNFAFVDQCRKRGIDAVGQEVAGQLESDSNCHFGTIAECAFPTGEFDAVTCHDVLEHVPDPVAFLKEIKRVLRDGGSFIVDFPDFFHESGKHHWKAVEHLWMLTAPQLERLLTDCGFVVEECDKPIPSKIVFYCTVKEEKRASILVPPGIGDAYWSFVKMESFIREMDLGVPDCYVQCFDDRKRAHDYVRRIPFVRACGYRDGEGVRPPEFDEAYLRDERNVFKNVMGCDYFYAFNGGLRYGRRLESISPEFECNWDHRMHQTLAEKKYGREMKANGPYVVAYFVPHGMYKSWMQEFPPSKIAEMLWLIKSLSGCQIYLIGAKWDQYGLAHELCKSVPDIVDLSGKTDLDQCFGLLRNANGVIGYPSGVTIMSAHFKTPTYLLWSKYFNENFHRYAIRSDAHDKWYDYGQTYKNDSAAYHCSRFLELMGVHVPEYRPMNSTYEPKKPKQYATATQVTEPEDNSPSERPVHDDALMMRWERPGYRLDQLRDWRQELYNKQYALFDHETKANGKRHDCLVSYCHFEYYPVSLHEQLERAGKLLNPGGSIYALMETEDHAMHLRPAIKKQWKWWVDQFEAAGFTVLDKTCPSGNPMMIYGIKK